MSAQDSSSNFFDDDIDSLFEDSPDDEVVPEPPPDGKDPPPESLAVSPKRTGFSLEAGFNFAGGYSPGWKVAPWYWTEPNEGFENLLLAKMESKISLDFQLSDILRVRQSLSFSIPTLELEVPEFFCDYNLLDIMFFRIGKYTLNWGISPNFQYTNLPARLPSGNEYPGDIYAAKVDIPIGIGGVQLVGFTRSGLLIGEHGTIEDLDFEDFPLGLKYNIAVPVMDIDIGFLYNQMLESRAIVSLKTTVFKDLEFYAEGMAAYNFYDFDNLAFSGSFGFFQEYFSRQLSVNAELFYNGEKNASYAEDETFFKDDNVVPFIYGFNTALNIRYKPSWLKMMEFFVSYLHGYSENTAQLVPGFRIRPLRNLNIYLAVPMALGSRDGTYYKNNVDEKNRPFSITMIISFSGSYRFGYYR